MGHTPANSFTQAPFSGHDAVKTQLTEAHDGFYDNIHFHSPPALNLMLFWCIICVLIFAPRQYCSQMSILCRGTDTSFTGLIHAFTEGFTLFQLQELQTLVLLTLCDPISLCHKATITH
ncbi:hypothetical protein HZ326_0146 [Fusarium oxysporum f. sp. albedinis]|nr:hypothetical protein HZ326_0146 [Fusarium oxysporum f. sp. albedinis]